jgi:hypothetical protein
MDISAIKHLSENLKDLEIESAKKIEDFSPIGKVWSLEDLALNNCGTIPSIGFIKHLPHLESMKFWDSTVVDGDVSPCLELEYVYFTNKKHYSHKLLEGDRFSDRPLFKEKSLPLDAEIIQQNANQVEQPLPPQAWKIRMDEGDDLFTDENIAAAEKVLKAYSEGISHLQNPGDEEILRKVRETILRLNALNEKYDSFIETLEREELCDFIMEEDITEEWREW